MLTNHLKTDQDWMSIESINLDPIKQKVMSSSPEDWSSEKADQAILEYRKFLYLNKRYPDVSMSPTKVVDEIWHTHILFTKRYFSDCNQIFGGYFHHSPHIGVSAELSHEQFENTKWLYKMAFGVDLNSLEKAESGGSCTREVRASVADCDTGGGTTCGGGGCSREQTEPKTVNVLAY